MMLEVKDLSLAFGGLKAVDNFHLEIEKGDLYGSHDGVSLAQ